MGTCEYLLLLQSSWLLGLAIYHMVRKRHAPRPDLVVVSLHATSAPDAHQTLVNTQALLGEAVEDLQDWERSDKTDSLCRGLIVRGREFVCTREAAVPEVRQRLEGALDQCRELRAGFEGTTIVAPPK